MGCAAQCFHQTIHCELAGAVDGVNDDALEASAGGHQHDPAGTLSPCSIRQHHRSRRHGKAYSGIYVAETGTNTIQKMVRIITGASATNAEALLRLLPLSAESDLPCEYS